jgi:autotransporter translocation and assembly factor TamB
MHISGITYVKRKKRWLPKLIYTILIILVIIAIVILCLLLFTNIQIPYISEWLES